MLSSFSFLSFFFFLNSQTCKNMKSTCAGKDNFERINYLYQLGNELLNKSGNQEIIAHICSSSVQQITKKTVQKLEPLLKKTFCKVCGSLLIAGISAKVRVRKKKSETCPVCRACRHCGAFGAHFVSYWFRLGGVAMYLQGVVKAVNRNLWTIRLKCHHNDSYGIDRTAISITVHMAYLAISDPLLGLPKLGTTIEITFQHVYANNHIFLCEKGSIAPRVNRDGNCHTIFLQLVEEHKLGRKQLFEIYNHHIMFREHFGTLVHNDSYEILLELIGYIVRHIERPVSSLNTPICENETVAWAKLRTPSTMKCVNRVTQSAGRPLWNFATEGSRPNDLLIGRLSVNKRLGFIMLGDSNSEIACLPINCKPQRLQPLLNRLVVIKKYRLFTEIFREKNSRNYEYIVFDLEDVEPVGTLAHPSAVDDIMVTDRSHNTPANSFKFKVVRKAFPNLTPGGPCEFWLEIDIESDLAHLCLGEHYMPIYPLLQPAESYTCYYITEPRNYTLTQIRQVKTVERSRKLMENTAKFQHTQTCAPANVRLLTVEEAVALLKSDVSRDTVSFEGTIKLKKFNDPISSYSTVNVPNQRKIGFGSNCSKTHIIDFVDRGKPLTVSLFLNNWDCLCSPLGLVPEMRVRVFDVLKQKKSYFKSCAFTRFEPVAYEPQIPFDSIQVLTQISQPSRSYFGYGDSIPSGVVIVGKPTTLFIRSLKLYFECGKCNRELANCLCTNQAKQVASMTTLIGCDEKGQFVILNQNLRLVQLLLGLSDEQWTVFLRDFEHVQDFDYARSDNLLFNPQDVNAIRKWRLLLAMNIKIQNEGQLSNLQLVCRKLDPDPSAHQGMSKWFAIDANPAGSFV